MKLLRIKDNSQQKKDAFSQVARLTGKIADKTLEQLEREGVFVFPETVKDAEDITQDQMILQSVNDTYRSGNVMGFLGYGDERIVIASRFCGEGEDYFFQYLLDKVLDFPNIVDLDADANQDNRLFNFLLFLFPYYLKAAMRKGLFKKYIRHRYNDGNVKGTIDVARHKPIDNIGNRDYLQVLAYMFRFDAKAGYYLYPEAEGSDDLKLWLNRGSTYEENVVPRDDISITKHGLKIPIDAQNYSEFTAKMKVQEQEFTSVFYA